MCSISFCSKTHKFTLSPIMFVSFTFSKIKIHLISSQDLEGGDDLVCSVRVGRFRGHEVNEGLEGDGTGAVGIHYAHDASKLTVALATEMRQVNPGETAIGSQTQTEDDRTNMKPTEQVNRQLVMVVVRHAGIQ